MAITEGIWSETNQREVEGMTIILQEILRKMETIDTRLRRIESTHKRKENEDNSDEEEGGGSGGKLVRRREAYGDRVTRQARGEFPGFEGDRVHEWLGKCERFFELEGTPAEMRVSTASVYLSGLAREWHYAFIKNRMSKESASWEEYADAIVSRFGSIEMSGPLAQLKRLREEDNFFTYVDSFISLISQVKLSDEEQVALFVEGLKEDNTKLISVLQPNNLQQAIAYARVLTTDEDSYISRARSNDQIVSLTHSEPNSTYDMIGDLDQHINEKKEVIDLPMKYPESLESLGITPPERVLLYGLFGIGKTLLAWVVVHHTGGTFIRDGSELVQMYTGEGSRMVNELFVRVGEQALSSIFMDEIDRIGFVRMESRRGEGDSEVQRTRLDFLNQLVGYEAPNKIKVLMATNCIDILDQVLLRPGQIDMKIGFPNPNEEFRVDILNIHSGKMKWVRGIAGTMQGKGFEALYGYSPPKHIPYIYRTTITSDGGEIHVTCFNAVADQYFKQIGNGKVYMISREGLRPAQKNFNHLRNEHEIFLEATSVGQPCVEDDSSIPKQQIHFQRISEVEGMDNNSVVSVIGVVYGVWPVTSIMEENGSETQKRTPNLKDEYGRGLEFIMWGNFCNIAGQRLQNLCDSEQFPVPSVKSGRVSDFNGKAVGTISSSLLFVELDIPETRKLRDGFQREGEEAPTISISRGVTTGERSDDARKMISLIKDGKLGTFEKPNWITMCATILYIKVEHLCYTACLILVSNRKCSKKVTNNGDGKWSPLTFGLYRILDMIGEVTYKLALPVSSLIHPTFHASKPKGSVSKGLTVSGELTYLSTGVYVLLRILDRVNGEEGQPSDYESAGSMEERIVKVGYMRILCDLQATNPNCTLEDKGASKGRVLMRGRS